MDAFALAAFEVTLSFIRKLVRSNCLKKQWPAELESFDRPSREHPTAFPGRRVACLRTPTTSATRPRHPPRRHGTDGI